MKSFLFLIFGVISLSSVTQAAFPDVPSGHPHSQAIDYVKTQGIVAGNPDGTFKPDQNISRAAFTKIIVETYFSAGDISSCSNGVTSFSDVDSAAWFAPYVCVASKKNLIKGYPDGTFRPGDNINVAEAAKIISAHRKGERTGNPWFKPYLDDLGEAGAIPTQVSAVDQSVTRGLMAEMIHRLDAKLTTKSAKMFDGSRFVAKVAAQVPAPTPTSNPNPIPVASKAAPEYEGFSQSRYNELLASGEKFVLNFSASWCPNCQRLDRTLKADLAELPAGTIILKTDYDKETALKSKYGVTRQTTGVFIEGGEAVKTQSGLSFSDIKKFFE